MNVRSDAKAQTLRCAVYTRKSSEEGLEQAFNSLHAQRASCEAYVLSQAGEGWTLNPEEYDDGGISGGTMDRPALQRLLADVASGKVNVVVVYKVDRLTRSLGDFARIVEVFDQAGASFVSVTQAFNTTTSMGRLTLNVLLSFAQFEREVTGERIRDKIALSKAKGMWMGGVVPLGYDLKDRSLLINEGEAERLRALYRRYLKLGSVARLRAELERQGARSKAWVSRDGRAMGDAVIGRGGLYHMLSNRLYLGEIVHHGLVHPGKHPAIVDRKLFDQVQRKLASQRITRRAKPTAETASPLTGRVFDALGQPMGPSFAYGRGGKRYRYYIAARLLVGGKDAGPPDLIRRVGAEALEQVLLEQLRRLAARPELSLEDLPALVQRLELRRTDTQLLLNAEDLFGLDHPTLAFEALQGRLGPGERAVWEAGDPPAIRISLPARMQLRGGRTRLSGITADPSLGARKDAGLIDALRSAHAELATLNCSPLTPGPALRHAQVPTRRHRRQLARLAFLAPDLQRMILDGRQPEGLTLRTMLKTELPLAWADQRSWFATLRQAQPALT